jgi:hypothetical protein
MKQLMKKKVDQRKKKIGNLKKELIIRVLRLKNAIHFVLAHRRGRSYGRKDKLGFLSKTWIKGKRFTILCLDVKKLKKALSQGVHFSTQAYRYIVN